MIYFVSNGNNQIKIGYTNDLKRRLSELQVSSSVKLKPIYIIEEGDMVFEHYIHGLCKKYIIDGEWFKEEVIEDFLLTHPFYKEEMKKIE